jgi:Mor family transcriptional regulator
MTEEQTLALEAEGQLYRKVHSKMSNLIATHEKLISGEIEAIVAELPVELQATLGSSLEAAYIQKITTEKTAIINELLAIYQNYAGGQQP